MSEEQLNMQNNSKEDDIDFFQKFSGFDSSLVEQDLGGGFFRLAVTEAEKRQAKHDIRWVEDALLELLRNSRDAHSSVIAVATLLHGENQREIVVIDNGSGMPEGFEEVVFEPRVTSRVKDYIEDEYGVHGRGMALYSIRLNAEEARVCFTSPFAGASIRAVFDLNRIPERKNQSEKPRIVKTQEGIELRGPKNIFYTVLDFYLKNRELEVFFGSPAEVLAEVIAHPGFSALRQAVKIEIKDAQSLMKFAEKIGLYISKRTAYRILAGEVQRALNLKKALSPVFLKSRHFKLPGFSKEEWEEITTLIESKLNPYLSLHELKITEIRQLKSKGKIKIQVVLEPSEEFD